LDAVITLPFYPQPQKKSAALNKKCTYPKKMYISEKNIFFTKKQREQKKGFFKNKCYLVKNKHKDAFEALSNIAQSQKTTGWKRCGANHTFIFLPFKLDDVQSLHLFFLREKK
jgi:hypothetical protein